MTTHTFPDPTNLRTRQDFGRALTELRERAGLSVRDVAKVADLSVSTVGGYFSGKHVPPLKPTHVLPSILRACGVIDAAELARWDDALRRVRRVPGPRPASAVAPYRGLAAFRTEDAPWFFGREAEVRRVLALVQRLPDDPRRRAPRMVAVVGASGSGKSSLLRAGVMAAVRDGELPELQGRCVLMTPGHHPTTALDACLAGQDPDAPVLLVVDQLEELFTDCADPAERRAFLARLLQLACDRAIVLFGLRADFYRQATAHDVLRSVLEDVQVVLGTMPPAQVRRAIIEPALRSKLELEDGLVDLLLADLPAEAGALPLLSHALLTMWQAAGRNRLTVADYLATGGMRAAVAGTAEHAYAELGPERQDAGRRLFLRLVAIGDDTADTRRRVELSELNGDADVLAALAVFVAHRLVTVDADTVEITHEALLDAWPRLRGWVDADRAGLRLRRQITEATRTWQELGRDASTLFRGGRLDAAEHWLEGRDAARELTSAEREFLRASSEREQSERRHERRQTRRLRRAAVTLAALLAVSVGLAGWSAWLTTTSSRDRDLALSRQVATASDRLRATDTSLAAQLAAVAYRQAATAEARSAVLDTSATATARRLVGPRGVLQALSTSADRRVTVGGSESGVIRIWSPAAPGGIDVEHPGGGTVFATALAPDGRLLAAGGSGGVSLWDLADPLKPVRLPAPPKAPTSTVFSLALAPGGRVLVAAGVGGVLRLWDVADPRRPMLLATPAADGAVLRSAAFGQGGTVLAAGDAQGKLRLWDVTDPRRPVPASTAPAGPTAAVYGIAFSPDGRWLAAGSADKAAYLWPVPASGATGLRHNDCRVPRRGSTAWRSRRTAPAWPSAPATARPGSGTSRRAASSAATPTPDR